MYSPNSDADTAQHVAGVYDQYLARWTAGETPTFEEFCEENPELAEPLQLLHETQIEDLLVEVLERGGGQERLDACCREWPAHAAGLRWLAGRMQALGGVLLEPPTQAPSGKFEGTRIGGYTIIGTLGEGATGLVLRAWDDKLHREVALKLLKQNAGMDLRGPMDRAHVRFVEEAQVTSQLDHPAIVPVHELGVADNGQSFFTMKLVKGEPFSRLISRVGRDDESWSLARGLQVIVRVGEALTYAHHKRVIHRDVKPENILVGSFGAVYLVDWGLTRVLDSSEALGVPTDELLTKRVHSIRSPGEDASHFLTEAGTKLGTPYYMSPEQARGDISLMEPAVDIYGLGAVLYHMLAGEAPFQRNRANESLEATLKRIDREAPTDIADLAPGLDPALAQVVRCAMARRPQDRFSTMGAFVAELTSLLELGATLQIGGGPSSSVDEPPPLARPGWGVFLRDNALVLALAAGLIFVLGLWTTRILGSL